MMKSRSPLSDCAATLLPVVATGCKPKNQRMLVAHAKGDVFLFHLAASNWNFGEAILS